MIQGNEMSYTWNPRWGKIVAATTPVPIRCLFCGQDISAKQTAETLPACWYCLRQEINGKGEVAA